MSTREKFLALAREKSVFRTMELVKAFGITRQSVAAQLKLLVDAGLLVRNGSTRAATYRLTNKSEAVFPPRPLLLIKKLKALEEDQVLIEIEDKLGLKNRLNRNA